MLIATWLMLLVTGSHVLIAYGHWRATQESNKLTRGSLRAAEALVRMTERAILIVESAEIEVTAGSQPQASFKIHNMGRGPARYKGFVGRLYVREKPMALPVLTGDEESATAAMVGANSTVTIWPDFETPLSVSRISEVLEGTETLIFDGEIIYTDQFGAQVFQDFCFAYWPSRKGAGNCRQDQRRPLR